MLSTKDSNIRTLSMEDSNFLYGCYLLKIAIFVRMLSAANSMRTLYAKYKIQMLSTKDMYAVFRR